MKRLFVFFTLLCSCLLGSLAPGGGIGPAAAAPGPDPTGTINRYVALGDSFAAGPLIAPYDPELRCLRSEVNYPTLLAERLDVPDFVDRTCSSAKTDHLYTSQFDNIGPQLDALTADTDLVTISLGANDVGMGDVVISCIRPFGEPIGKPCMTETYVKDGVDSMAVKIDAAVARVGKALDEVRRRAPKARVLITSYANYIAAGGCYSLDTPIYPIDADYIQGLFNRLGAGTAREAAKRGVTYVDFVPAGKDHTVCAPLNQRWSSSLLELALVRVPWHPTAAAMRAYTGILEDTLGSPVAAQGVNWAIGQKATASSSQDDLLDNHPAGHAVDGTTWTRWASDWVPTAWLTVDLGTTRKVRMARIDWEAAYAKRYSIQTSVDGTTWKTVRTVEDGAAGVRAVYFPATTARFVRIRGLERGTEWGYSIKELGLFS